MEIKPLCQSYFNGFNELYDFHTNSVQTTFFAALKVVSYFTVVIPFTVAVVYAVSSLDLSVGNIFKTVFPPPREYQMFQTDASKTLRTYVSHLPEGELTAKFQDDFRLNIEGSGFDISIRREDLFASKAQVIVNAANTHLGGGGGIDGAIHARGGSDYVNAHAQLKRYYKSSYVEGHAAMIESGALKQKDKIDWVIVVAGPAGASTPKKEDQLYSCYFNSLMLAHEKGLTSIAFPSISTGLFGFPLDRGAAVSLQAIRDFAQQYPTSQLKTISIHFLPSEPKTFLEVYAAVLPKKVD
jgi:O-acetyl-ADP-ribose deacetylase (regulator of RNase III)